MPIKRGKETRSILAASGCPRNFTRLFTCVRLVARKEHPAPGLHRGTRLDPTPSRAGHRFELLRPAQFAGPCQPSPHRRSPARNLSPGFWDQCHDPLRSAVARTKDRRISGPDSFWIARVLQIEQNIRPWAHASMVRIPPCRWPAFHPVDAPTREPITALFEQRPILNRGRGVVAREGATRAGSLGFALPPRTSIRQALLEDRFCPPQPEVESPFRLE